MTESPAVGRVDEQERMRPLRGLKICRISTVPFFMVSQLKGQAEYLRDIGMRVTLISSDGPEWELIRTGDGLEGRIIDIPRSLDPWKDLLAGIRLTKYFLTHRFDIVHSTTPKAGLLTALAAFLAGVRIRIHTFTGQRWVTLQGLGRWTARMADRLIGILDTKCYADSGSQAEFLVREGILSSRKIAVIGRGSLAGVDTNRFHPDRWPVSEKQRLRRSLDIPPASKVLIFVGRLSADKGILELLSAFRALRDMGYDADLLLVGPQDQDRGGKGSLDLAGDGPSSRLHPIGYSDCPERYLAIADIFCLPSYREGFGTTVIEAAAMGIPTLGTAINGLTDAVVDGETGILVPPRDTPALLAGLKRLLDNPDELGRMGKAARERCLQHFDAGRVNAGVAEEYLFMLKRKKIVR